MDKLNLKHFTFTVTSFVAIWYILCVAFIAIAGSTAVKFFNLFFHGLDLTKIMKTPTIVETIIGFVLFIILTVIFSALFVKLWNYFYESMEV